MFTGLVAEKGSVKNIVKGRFSAALTINARMASEGLELGESIAVNGVCLTVTAFDSSGFTVDIMLETLKKTNLGMLKPGADVNLERALKIGDRLGGHLVTGHVDGTGIITVIQKRGIATEMWLRIPSELEQFLVARGSIALDGVSLTLAELKEGALMVSLIPHTKQVTTLEEKAVGDLLNIETDILGKYVKSLILTGDSKEQKITRDFLASNGFF